MNLKLKKISFCVMWLITDNIHINLHFWIGKSLKIYDDNQDLKMVTKFQ